MAYFVTDKKFGPQATAILQRASVPVDVTCIVAGKFRRYHRLALWRQLLDVPTLLQNCRDFFYTGIGFLQSWWLLWRIKPDVVFTKGGFVCVPLGFAAKLLRIPLVIHESDAHAGLANRLLARWASTIATGWPLDNYSYPPSKAYYVGIPIDDSFRPVDSKQQQHFKGELGFHDTTKPLVVVTGGGLGAQNINRAMTAVAASLLDTTAILHITGTATYDETVKRAPEHIDYILRPFVSTSMATLFGAADVVVTRAGATALQELAAMAKPVIIVPNPHLTGGHQLKNAQSYHKAGAAVVLSEESIKDSPLLLARTINDLLTDSVKRLQLGKNLRAFAKPDAASQVAALIVKAAGTK